MHIKVNVTGTLSNSGNYSFHLHVLFITFTTACLFQAGRALPQTKRTHKDAAFEIIATSQTSTVTEREYCGFNTYQQIFAMKRTGTESTKKVLHFYDVDVPSLAQTESKHRLRLMKVSDRLPAVLSCARISIQACA